MPPCIFSVSSQWNQRQHRGGLEYQGVALSCVRHDTNSTRALSLRTEFPPSFSEEFPNLAIAARHRKVSTAS
jgi:hypothetical protein